MDPTKPRNPYDDDTVRNPYEGDTPLRDPWETEEKPAPKPSPKKSK